jgi:hypothetical protein
MKPRKDSNPTAKARELTDSRAEPFKGINHLKVGSP